MLNDIYDPLTAYKEVYCQRFKEVACETFAQLAAEAKVDVEANRRTIRKINKKETEMKTVKSKISSLSCVGCLSIAAIGFIIYLFVYFSEYDATAIKVLLFIGILMCGYAFYVFYQKTTEQKKQYKILKAEAEKLKQMAWKQMEPLNRLYDWDILTRMMVKTVPKLEFDPYFTAQRLADLKSTYGWNDEFNKKRSVIYSHSGLINGNPFIICRTRMMQMGTKTYKGKKTIYWTTYERDANGRRFAVRHSETLTAYVKAPYPIYKEATRLIYGNTAAPDLIFNRKKSKLAESSESSFKYNWELLKLKKKNNDLKNEDFALMTNQEFEVRFNTSDRNNNHQHALLFTPLAQESILKLLKEQPSKQVKSFNKGYGDDFNFYKNKMINTIYSDHMQSLNLDLNPKAYHNFDYDKAELDFYQINAEYFRAIYFALAPLLCIPMYQQIRPAHEIYGRDMLPKSSFWEHEALANFWGQDHFKHPECVTNCVLKTQEQQNDDGSTTLVVNAYGHRSERRLSYVYEWGSDGRRHSVPVYWDEYFPVTGTGVFEIKEDNHDDSQTASQQERLNHIHEVLKESHCNVYRRHIASRMLSK